MTSGSSNNLRRRVHEGRNCIIYDLGTTQPDGPVVVKVLRSAYPSARQVAHLRNEYEITKDLDIKGVRRARKRLRLDGKRALELDFVDAQPVAALFAQGKRTIEDFLALAIGIAEVLGKIHEREIIHGNLSGSNVLANPETLEATVIDFGLSSRVALRTLPQGSPYALDGDLEYISPEKTGRINRVVDYRTDLYSLGVTFYQLLAGGLPFDASDAIALVHSHIAEEPTPLHELPATQLPGKVPIPRVISDIVARLMAKNPEDRYQTCRGLRFDLERCLHELSTTGRIAPFHLAQNDVMDGLRVSQKLYGRHAEINRILRAYEAGASGRAELVLVAGYSGVGKTSLVHEVNRPIGVRGGQFFAGKFDLPQRNKPYSAFVEAFRALVQQLLAEPEDRLHRWRADILDALGPNAQVIIDVIPEVELVTGPQPELEQLTPGERLDRFNQAVLDFVKTFARQERPLVVYLDDLQWADIASLNLLEALVGDDSLRHAVFIGAYRDNEVSPSHPLTLAVDAITKRGGSVQTITLEPLGQQDLDQLLADTLAADQEEVHPLGMLVMEKTRGNPFFVAQFLRTLHQQGQLRFDPDRPSWRWDLGDIEAQKYTDNVVDLLIDRVSGLPEATLSVMRYAADIGHDFDIPILASVTRRTLAETTESLTEAIREGLVFSFAEELSDRVGAEDSASEHPHGLGRRLAFAHDRVQEACSRLTEDAERAATHLRIGRILRDAVRRASGLDLTDPFMAVAAIPVRIFDVVLHLNAAVDLVSGDERRELAVFNLLAGRKARASTAYAVAAKHFATAVDLLGDQIWVREYELALAVHTDWAEVEYAAGGYERAEELFAVVLSHTRTLLDKAPVQQLMLNYYQGAHRIADAIDVGVQFLNELSVTFPAPESIDRSTLDKQMLRFRRNIAKVSMAGVPKLSACGDATKAAAVDTLAGLIVPFWVTRPNAAMYAVFEVSNLTLEYGACRSSAVGLGLLAAELCSGFAEYQLGYELGEASVALQENSEDNHFNGVVNYVFFNHTHYWRQGLMWRREELLKAHRAALQNGNTQWASYCINHYCMRLLLAGEDLHTAKTDYDRLTPELKRLNKRDAEEYFHPPKQAVYNLLGLASDPLKLTGEFYDEVEGLRRCREAGNLDSMGLANIFKLLLLCVFDEYGQALEVVRLSEGQMIERRVQFQAFLAIFLSALAMLQNASDASENRRSELLAEAIEIQTQLRMWADVCPANFAAMFLLVSAEVARVEGETVTAVDLYSDAISAARESGFTHIEAMAHELAYKLWAARGNREYAASHLGEAWRCYQQWGALAKVADLEKRHPELAVRDHPRRIAGVGSAADLDIETVIKASHAITSEIDLQKLLSTMLGIMIENAGADRGVIVLIEGGELALAAVAEIGPGGADAGRPYPADKGKGVCEAVVRYAERTGEAVVVTDAAQDPRYTKEPYILRNRPRSILAMPIRHTDKRLGVLYLENSLAKGAFTQERVALLNVLLAQAAISMENAALFESQKRTEEQLRGSEANYRTLIENIPQRIFLKDRNSAYISCNGNYAADLGIAQSDIAGMTDHDFHPAELADKYRSDDQAVMASAQPLELEERYLKDGVELTVQTMKTPVRDDSGEVVGILAVFWDITERKRAAEKQRKLEAQIQHAQKLESLGVLAGGIAHDFNNMLVGILGNSDLALLDMPATSPARPSIENVKKLAVRAADLAKQMLAYSGRGKFVVQALCLSTLVEDMSHLLEVSISKRVTLRYDFSGNLPAAEADATQIRQVVMNMITNASEAIGDANGTIVIATGEVQADRAYLSDTFFEQELPEGRYVFIEVSDTGCGMDEETRERLFDPFFTTKFAGRGLGLSAVLGIVRGHHGALRIYSEMGKGTRFKVLLPASDSTVVSNRRAIPKDAWRPSGVVLVVDDEESVRNVAKAILERHGLTVITAEDGRVGVEEYRKHANEIVAVLLDMTMPEMNGEEAFREFRRIRADVRVILTSGYDEQEATQRFGGKGLAGFLQKPFDVSQLLSKLREATQGMAVTV